MPQNKMLIIILVEAGALFAKDSTNVFDFPLAQVIVNINKQHLNF